jgi:proline dehydrogenase
MSLYDLLSAKAVILARKWIAGVNPEEALELAKKMNKRDEIATINYLGEELVDKNAIDNSVDTYLRLIKEINRQRLRAEISVKPTQLGLKLSESEFRNNYVIITNVARKTGVFVWLDAEMPSTISVTNSAYLHVLNNRGSKGTKTGVCIQARLKSAYKNAEFIAKRGGIIRLVKGAYKTPAAVGYTTREAVDTNYIKIMRMLFSNGAKFMVATHDINIINMARKMESAKNTRVMFGMLKGIRSNVALKLAVDGENIHIYLPFGEEWIDYSIRRLKEQGHATLALASIFGR